jgi:hypothetical protein
MTARSPGISLAAARWLLPALLIQCVAGPAFAASPFFRGPIPEAQPLVQPQSLVQPAGVSREDAAGLVQRQTGGRVLSTTPAQRGGANGYDVRVLVDGKRVKDVFVDDRGNVRARR